MKLRLSKKKFFLLLFFFVLVITIPLTIFLVQKQISTSTQATPNTTLSFTPSTQLAEVGDKINFDIIMSPGNNQVNYVKLVIKFDPTKINTTQDNFLLNSNSTLSILEGPVLGSDTLSVTLSIGNDPTKVITTDTNIGTVTFDVIDSSALPTDVTFDSSTEIRSIEGSQDSYNENVFLSGNPATVTILTTEVATSSPTIKDAVSPQSSESAQNMNTLIASAANNTNNSSEIPACSSLGLDVAASGIAPYTINFTASGTDIDGTIEKVAFDFGDGGYEDITSGGGISTDTIDITLSHTYDSPGEYVAGVILTDDTGNTSDTNTCTTAITITDEFGNTTADNSGDTENIDTNGEGDYSTAKASLSGELTPTLAPTGPSETIMGIGALGGILLIIGTLLFFAL